MPMQRFSLLMFAAGLTIAGMGSFAVSADWPMWRCDAARSGVSPEALPANLHLQWVRQLPHPQPAWPDEPRLAFDWTYEPVVGGRTMFVPSSANDSLVALDTETGRERWRFYAQGPVRLPPVAWQGRVFFVSDDGCLFCLDGADGRLLWKLRGGPNERRLLGNGRLISAWPARGGPVVAGDRVYFAAGIWPSMGVFVHCVDARSGRVIWTNDDSGVVQTEQPHGGQVTNGPSPQGSLVLVGNKLLVPCGRTYPAVFDARDGRLRAYRMAGRDEVGCQVVAAGGYFFAGVSCTLGEKGDFEVLNRGGYRLPVVAGPMLFHATQGRNESALAPTLAGRTLFPAKFSKQWPVVTEARDLTAGKWVTESVGKTQRRDFVFPVLWRMPGFQVAIQAGNRLYGTIGSDVVAVDLPSPGGAPHVSWRGQVEGHPLTMLAADGKLFVVADQGSIYCFGDKPGPEVVQRFIPEQLDTAPDRWAETARRIGDAVGQEPGFGLVLGLADGRLVEALLRQTRLRVIAVDPDQAKIDALRRRWDAAGLYGDRVTAVAADPLELPLPPYMARMITSENLASAGIDHGPPLIRHMFEALRPLGGTAYLALDSVQEARVSGWVQQLRLHQASLGRDGELVLLRRVGPLAGSADWTHEFADAANTRVSSDARVQGPFGILWFGGPLANRLLYPKQLVPPTPAIVDGRMFVQGPGAIRAVDIYTGAILWTHPFSDEKENRDITFDKGDLRVTYRPPASGGRDYARIKRVGYHCAAATDGVYLAVGPECVRLDPATGRLRSRITMVGDDGRELYWNSLRICDDVMLASATSAEVPIPAEGFGRDELRSTRHEFRDGGIARNLEATVANYLVAVDRNTEKTLWRRRAQHAFLGTQQFWHPWGTQSYQDTSVAAAPGRLFCLDMLPADVLAAMKRRGLRPSGTPQLLALEARSGNVRWQQRAERFCSLAYSSQYDVLVAVEVKEASWKQGFVNGEVVARKGADGSILWKVGGVDGPLILHHRTIYAWGPALGGGVALDLLTGEKRPDQHPLTGEPIPWRCPRGHGCNVPIGGEHLLAFRSATAAYYDLTPPSGTVAITGFRAGCSNTLIPAGGILNAPNYAYGCVCNFQNDTSLALVPSADVEAWAWTEYPPITRPVRRLGLNMGAAGDRRADDGTFWPACCGNMGSPVKARMLCALPPDARVFRWHASRAAGDGPRWVASSCVDGVQSLSIELSPAGGPTIPYTVSLLLIEPQTLVAGDRVFDIVLQGKTVAAGVDVVAEAGCVRRAVLRKWDRIDVRRQLEISFVPKPGVKLPYAALCGVEIRTEHETVGATAPAPAR